MAIFDMVLWCKMTDGTSENRMSGFVAIVVAILVFGIAESDGRLCNRLLKYSHYMQFIIYTRRVDNMNITTIFYFMLEVLHIHTYTRTHTLTEHRPKSLPDKLNWALATEAVADYYVDAENNIVDDVINQFSWTYIHSLSLTTGKMIPELGTKNACGKYEISSWIEIFKYLPLVILTKQYTHRWLFQFY